MTFCGCGCRRQAPQRHHCVTRQEMRKHGGDPKDERNLISLSPRCHAAHHGRSRVLPLHRLPDSVFEFARELMGGGPAFVYLARYYAGGDPRLDALLEDEAA